MEVSEAALSALAATSAALDCHEQRIGPLVQSRDSVQPVQPETPQLLPVVHSLWAPLLQALKVQPQPPDSVLLPVVHIPLTWCHPNCRPGIASCGQLHDDGWGTSQSWAC